MDIFTTTLAIIAITSFFAKKEVHEQTRIHSSRMRTDRSSRRHGESPHPPRSKALRAGTPLEQSPPEQASPGVGLETPPPRPDLPQLPPWMWAWGPTFGQIPPKFALGCGPGDPPTRYPSISPWVWAWKPARHAGIPPARHAGIPPPPRTESQTAVKT